MKVTIFVEPAGKARPRTVRRGDKTITYTPQKTRDIEYDIRRRVMDELMLLPFPPKMPLRIVATFYRLRPKGSPKRILLPVTRPDWDNYAKLLTDALEKYLYENDSQITTAVINKMFWSPAMIEFEIEEDTDG